MASTLAILEFERVFGRTIDAYLDSTKTLMLDSKCRTKETLGALIRALDFNRKITGWSGVLSLQSNNISATKTKDLAKMLAKNSTIHTLNLQSNDIGAAGAKDLAAMLTTNSTPYYFDLFQHIIGPFGANSTIHTLDLGFNYVGAAGAKDLATMLAINSTIHTLNLRSNNIGATGAKDLAQILATNSTIHTLDLDDNNIGAAGAKDLAQILATNSTIHTLSLGSNDIGAAGTKDLATMLAKNSTIHTLSLHYNIVMDAGAKDLATMLATNTSVHTLNLHGNNIGAAGAKDLATMLAKNSTIHTLNIRDNSIIGDDSTNAVQVIGAALVRNKDRRTAFQHAVNVENIQAIEMLLESHLEDLDIKKEMVVSAWNIVSQNNPKQSTMMILAHLAIQTDAFVDLLMQPGYEPALQYFTHLDGAVLTQLQMDSRPEIKNMMEIALMSVDSPFDQSLLAQQLTSLLALPTDVFAADGSPLPSIFLERATTSVSKHHVDLAVAAVRYLLERQHKHEVETWVSAHPDATTLMTGLDVTKSAEKHLERYADTPLDLQQTNPNLDRMVVPEWYDQVLVQPAVEAVLNQLEHRRVAALADTTQTDTCQQLAKESLEADRQLYGGALSKAQQQNRATTTQMELLAARKELEIRGTWVTNPDTGKPQRPTHPNMPASATVAQVKLQAVQQGGAFRKVIESMRLATGLTVSMVRGGVDRDSGLLRKRDPDNEENLLDAWLYMSKGSYRIAQKLWVRGNVRSICDINRALFVADTFDDLLKATEHIFSRSDIHIVEIKDRVNNPTYGGWSDLVLLFSVEGTSGHIHELQLALTPMMVARGAMAAHEAYARARYFVEMLQKCDLVYDAESREVKQKKIIEKLNNVIEDLKRPGRAMCGWLQQADGKNKQKWKRRWFVLSNGWLTYHDSNTIDVLMSTSKRIKAAKGATPMITCSIVIDKDPKEGHKFEVIDATEGTHFHLDKSNKQEPLGETHTRQVWVDTMLSHTGCRMG